MLRRLPAWFNRIAPFVLVGIVLGSFQVVFVWCRYASLLVHRGLILGLTAICMGVGIAWLVLALPLIWLERRRHPVWPATPEARGAGTFQPAPPSPRVRRSGRWRILCLERGSRPWVRSAMCSASRWRERRA